MKMEKKKGRMLKLDKDDPQKELEFEVECALDENPSERLDTWLEWNIQMLKRMEELHGYKDTPQIIKRS